MEQSGMRNPCFIVITTFFIIIHFVRIETGVAGVRPLFGKVGFKTTLSDDKNSTLPGLDFF